MPRLSRNFAFVLAGYALPMICAVGAMPLLARYAGPDRFGFLTLGWSVIGYSGFLDLGLSRVFARRFAQSGNEPELANEMALLNRAGWRLCIVAIAVGLVLAAVPAQWLAGHDASGDFTAEVQQSWLILVATIPFVVMANLWRGAMEGREAFDAVNKFRILFGTWSFAAPLAALLWTHRLPALVLAMAAGRWIAAALHWGWCRRHLPHAAADRKAGVAVGVVIIEGAWITISAGVGTLIVFLDRFVLAGLLSLKAVAAYTVAQEIALRILFIPGAVGIALFPRLAALATADAEAGAVMAERSARISLALILPVCILAAVLARPGIGWWLGHEFSDLCAPVLQCMMFGVAVMAPIGIVYTKLQAFGRARASALLHLSELPPYAILLWFCARSFGMLGAAGVWTARVAADAAVSILQVRRIDPHAFGIRTFASITAAVAALAVSVAVADQLESLPLQMGLVAAATTGAMACTLSRIEWGGLLRVLSDLMRSLGWARRGLD